MLEGKELWTGCLALDEAQGVLHLGKQAVLVAEIEEAQLCRGAVRFGKKDADQGIQTPLLCLRLKRPRHSREKRSAFARAGTLCCGRRTGRWRRISQNGCPTAQGGSGQRRISRWISALWRQSVVAEIISAAVRQAPMPMEGGAVSALL